MAGVRRWVDVVEKMGRRFSERWTEGREVLLNGEVRWRWRKGRVVDLVEKGLEDELS